MQWTWQRFDALSGAQVYEMLALRCRVFILEQGAYLDPDGADLQAWHLQGRDAAGVLQAYLRGVDPGVKYSEPSIGRVITAPELRRSGLGRELMRDPHFALRASTELGVEIDYSHPFQATDHELWEQEYLANVEPHSWHDPRLLDQEDAVAITPTP